MYQAMTRRKVVEELTHRKTLTLSTMIAAFYANTNLDSKENQGVRAKMVDEFTENMENQFRSTVAKVYGQADPVAALDEIDMNDPWWQAAFAHAPLQVHEEIGAIPPQKDQE